MAKKNWMLIDGRPRAIKPGITLSYMQAKYPERDIRECMTPPSMSTMGRWVSHCYARALDGCRVEPDGTCEHGFPSWLIHHGLI